MDSTFSVLCPMCIELMVLYALTLQLLRKTSARQIAKIATPLEQLHQALEQVSDMRLRKACGPELDLFHFLLLYYNVVGSHRELFDDSLHNHFKCSSNLKQKRDAVVSNTV